MRDELHQQAAVDRRGFLGLAATATGALAAGALSLRGEGAGGLGLSTARAIEPIQRMAGPKFKFSMAGYSYRQLFTAKKFVDKPFPLETFIEDCAKLQLDGTELTSYYFPTDVKPEYLRDIKRLAFRLGLDVSGTAVSNNFCTPPGKDRDEQLAKMRQWIENAEILGAPVIRIFSGNAHKGQSLAEAQKLAIEGMEESCEYAGKHGVTLALENHGGLTTKPEGMLALVKGVKSPWFGVNFDSGNFHGADPYAELAMIAPYAVNVQIKVKVKAANGPSGPSDYPRVAKILRDAGYRGYIVLEYEETDDPRVVCPREMELIRKAFA